MAKMSIVFDGFEDIARDLDRIGGDLRGAVNEALNDTEDIVQNNLRSAAAIYVKKGRKGYATGKMYGTIIKSPVVKWSGTTASVEVGFNLKEPGGYHSIFIMYGTPKIKKDTKVYNAIRGARTRREIAEKQKEIMEKYLSLGGKK